MVMMVTQRAGAAGHRILPGGTGQRGGVDGAHQCRDAVPRHRRRRGEPPGILPAAGAVFHHAQRGEIAGGRKDLFQQSFHRHAPGHPAQGGQAGVELPVFR